MIFLKIIKKKLFQFFFLSFGQIRNYSRVGLLNITYGPSRVVVLRYKFLRLDHPRLGRTARELLQHGRVPLVGGPLFLVSALRGADGEQHQESYCFDGLHRCTLVLTLSRMVCSESNRCLFISEIAWRGSRLGESTNVNR